MKHRTVRAIAVFCLLAGCAVRTPEQQTRHDDAKYASTLNPYERDLKAGLSRKEVEDYFRARNIPFSRMCCVVTPHTYRTLDDIIELRTENRPWPCGTEYVYIGFQFGHPEDQPHTVRSGADDTDTLVGIHIFKMVDCV